MKNFIKNYKQKGIIGVSSKYLVEKMLKKVNFSENITIIQLGVGTGIFTKKILKKMTNNSKLYAFEIDKKYTKFTKEIIDSRVEFIWESAEKMERFIDNEVDVIISTLPFASLPTEILPKIIKASDKKLKKNGVFLQYQYFLTDKKKIEKIFGKKAKLDFEIRNFSPAFIYKIEK